MTRGRCAAFAPPARCFRDPHVGDEQYQRGFRCVLNGRSRHHRWSSRVERSDVCDFFSEYQRVNVVGTFVSIHGLNVT